ncbi:MAG: PDZ domain-containing protein [Actinobacteria bacterium]|nr:PDZ domain-containing protein [Actinomycetota bacterium]
MAARSPKPSKSSSKPTSSKRKVTVRSSVKKSVSPVPTLAQSAELNSVANKQQELENVANKQQVIAGSKDLEKKNDRVALTFLGIFVAALFFVIGAGFGNSQGNSLVDGAIDELVSNSTIEVDRGTLERAAIEGALKASGDGWANYFPSTTLETLNNLTANVLTGIGVSIREARSGAIEIAGIQENTPAFRNGLQVGDQLIQVNGTDVQGASLTTVAALIRGDLGKEVVIQVNRDGASKVFSLLTERVDVKTVDASQITSDIAYLSINSFASGTSSEFYSALKSLDSSKGVVIDLRDNPGGLIEEAVSIAELFIGRGVVVSYRANGEEKVFSANNPSPSRAPVVLMINKGTKVKALQILGGLAQLGSKN